MKTPTKFFGALVVVAFVLVALNAYAEGETACIIQTSTGAATTTGTRTALGDGGTPCNWSEGSVVAMQCDDSVVCYDPNASNGGVATVAGDLCVNFQTGNVPADPILIGLNVGQQKISLIAKSVGDAGALSLCKMAYTKRRTGQ